MRTGWRIGVSLLVVGIVVAGAAAIGWIGDQAGRDDAFSIDVFDRIVLVEPDGATFVQETIDVTFHESRRGIFRDLPDEHRFDAGDYQILAVDHGSSDQPWNFVVEQGPDGPRVRIGDASVWLDPGAYRYRLRYGAPTWSHVLADDRDIVETRIDVPGFDWPTDVDQVRLVVLAPGEILDVTCVEGPRGSTRPCAAEPRIGDGEVVIQLGPYGDHEAATVAVHTPADAFTANLPVVDVTPLGTRGLLEPVDLTGPHAALLLALLLALPLLVLDAVYARAVYRDRVTDPHLHDRQHPTAIPAPPRGMRPPEIAGLLLRRNSEPLFLSTLVDLDQRGLVRTSAVERGGDKIDLTVARADADTPPPPGDQRFLDDLLGSGSVTFADKYDQTVARKVRNASQHLVKRARHVFRDHGLEHDSGKLLRSTGFKVLAVLAMIFWIIVLAAVIGSITTLPGGAFFGVTALVIVGWGLAHLPWAHHRVPLNSAGRDLTAQARSFDEFVRTVESEQLEWAAGQPGIDHLHPAVSLLPYAIVLGHADSWFNRFGSVMAQVAGAAAAGTAAGGTAWWASQRSFSGVRSSQSATSTAPSSSSGGGGGGSGGGGGGGGSW